MFLQEIWFFIWGLLWAVFFMTDGFDFGIGTLYPFLGKTERDKRVMLNAMGPLWDGNEVWLITAGGVTFAAFPLVYATMFSSLYAPLMLILFALILRGVSMEFRGKVEDERWKKVWDTSLFIGSFAPALLFGVAFANIFQGIPFDDAGYHGSLIALLNPYGLLGGLLFVLLFLIHGALWLAIRSEDDLQNRAVGVANKLWPALLGTAVVFLIASWFATRLYDNYLAHPALFLVILLTVAGLLGIKYFLTKQAWFKAWFSSALTIVGATFFGVIGLFPNLFPSSIDFTKFSLSAYNASSSPLTLKIMLTVVVLFIPVVIGYQVFTYKLFSGKVTDEDLDEDEAY